MSNAFEFRHQSLWQRSVLIGLKAIVLGGLSLAIYSLAMSNQTTPGSLLRSAANIYVSFWLYANLLQVKVEVQELFVEPMNIRNGLEFMVLGGILYTVSYFF